MNAFWKSLAVAALGLSAGIAQAGGINWSIGISLPPVSTVISNDSYHQPYYEPAPVYHVPAPIYHAPPPVVYRPAPVYHAPPPVFYQPAPTYIVERRFVPPRHEWRHHRGHGGHAHGHRHWRDRDHDRGHGHHRRGRDD